MQSICTATRVSIQQPELEDAAQVYDLVASAPPLELNSCYTYMLLSTHFAATSAVAKMDGKIVGFVGAYVPQSKPDVLFVWQVVVADQARGQGIARRMMEHILKRNTSKSVRWLEASVTPSNEASRRLFQGCAAAWGAACEISEWLKREHFNAPTHEPEELFQIGPLDL